MPESFSKNWRVPRWLSIEKRKEVQAILKIYDEIDARVAKFQQASGLRCLDGCGDCCRSEDVMASTLEMLPIALILAREGTLDEYMGKVDQENPRDRCIFYSDHLLPGGGFCRIYPLRPLVCRLFGFTARRDKHGCEELIICHKIKKHFPRALDKARRAGFQKRFHRAPISRDYVMKAFALSPREAGDLVPINQAFYKAAEKIQFYGYLFQKMSDERRVSVMANKSSSKAKPKKGAAKPQSSKQTKSSGCCCSCS